MYGGDDPPYCPTRCRIMMGERTPPQEPPCDTCMDEKKRVELLSENEPAAKIYIAIRGQTIKIWNGERDIPVDINHLAVWAMIDAYEIKNRLEVFNRILRAWHEAQQRKRDNEG